MKINILPIDEIKPYEKNPRQNQDAVQKVATSIKEFGFRQPIVVDKNNVIIAGHTRLLAAKELGLNEVPVHVAESLTKQQIKAYRLADNRVAQESSWDTPLLIEELKDLQFEGFDLDLTGFDSSEIDSYLNPTQIDEEIFDERGEGEHKETISKLGDVWILGNHRLMCGDSTNPLDVEKLLNNNKPNLMVTDPPYGVEYDPEWRKDRGEFKGSAAQNLQTGEVQNDNRADWTDTYSLFTGNIAYIWHSAKFTHVIAKNIEDCGFDLITQIIWVKQHFALSRGDYHWQHEPCWYAVRNNSTHNWQGARDQSTIWEIKNNNPLGNHEMEEKLGHGTQKPIECMLRPIKNNSVRGEYIYDPFGGSGTTLIACERSDRKCLMMEIEPKYCDMVIRRWQKETLKKAKLESTNQSFNEIEDGESKKE